MMDLPVDDMLWTRIAALLPPQPARPKGGRPRLSDREALNGILFVLKAGIPWEHLPQDLGYGSGMTCWRRLHDWQEAGAWPQVCALLRAEACEAEEIDWARASRDASGTTRRGPRRASPSPLLETQPAGSAL